MKLPIVSLLESGNRLRAARSAFAAALVLALSLLAWLSVPAAGPVAGQAPDPAACLTENPFLASTFFVRGETFDDEPAVVAFDDTPDDAGHFLIANVGQVGAVYGLAYDATKDALYAGAYHKRNSHYGPLGPGGVYQIQVNGGGVTPFLTVPSAGGVAHDPEDNYHPDERARGYVGKTSLGDVELSADGQQLYVMNLNDRRIHRFRLPDGQHLGSFAHGAANQSWARDARPFALAVRDGWLYHGLVNTSEQRQSLTNLSAHVYASRLDGTSTRQVAQAWLGYERPAGVANWNPWLEDDNRGRGAQSYPQPMVVDIEFADNGDMILGLRDRYMDTGPSVTEVYRRAPGDVLRLPKTGTLSWTFEPSAEEFYTGDNLPGIWEEIAMGGLARMLRRDVVVTTAIDPFRTYTTQGRRYPISAGAIWLDNTTGADLTPLGNGLGREELMYNAGRHEGPQGKALGLGDLELICYVPPTPTPTRTATATRTPTATPTATATASITPTPRTYRIYLPHGAYDEICIPDAYHADVVLVLDRSTSMLRSVEEGGAPKNEAAIAAAKLFLSRLDFTPDALGRHDQVAVVGFNDLAWTELDLTNDAGAAVAALDAIRTKTREGTRLDLAMLEGQKPLDGPNRKPENLPVIILLTDGLPNRVPTPTAGGVQEDTVLWAAMAARARGTRVYTIGLGKPTDILPRLMISMASEKWMYYYAPRGEDLGNIYDQIAHSFDECGPHTWLTPTPCVAEIVHADVVLVLDMSTSMLRTTSAGRSKQAAAIEAGQVFVDELDVEVDGWGRQDQAAVVGFNDTAWREVPLSGDRAAVEAGLVRLPFKTAEGTRLDLAFLEGQKALDEGVRLSENGPVMIVLTDGLPNRVPLGPGGTQEETVLAAAAAAKARGTRVYTIGLGAPTDIDAALLKESASAPDMFYYAPDGEDLARIYREIAGRIGECR